MLQWGHGTWPWKTTVGALVDWSPIDAASMGPRHWPWKTLGRPSAAASTSDALQWGHGTWPWKTPQASRHHWPIGRRFNGATAMRPWKTLAVADVDQAAVARFNGATARGRGRRGAIRTGRADRSASMGPRQGRGRQSRIAGHRPAARDASMGPRRWPWKTPSLSTVIADLQPTLQWGHGNRPWKTSQDRESRRRAAASMGPRHVAVEDGTDGRSMDAAGLQWGHGTEAVEDARPRPRLTASMQRFNGATALRPWKTMRRPRSHRRPSRLQWGHGTEAVEDAARFRRTLHGPTRFNGATTLGRGRPGSAEPVAASTCRRFNGATALRPWKTAPSPMAATCRDSLQWGHGTLSRGRRSRGRATVAGRYGFNGATTLRPWKTC